MVALKRHAEGLDDAQNHPFCAHSVDEHPQGRFTVGRAVIAELAEVGTVHSTDAEAGIAATVGQATRLRAAC